MKKKDVPALREALKEMIRELKREKKALTITSITKKPKIKYPLKRDSKGRMMKGEKI
jgi:hypothetical protein